MTRNPELPLRGRFSAAGSTWSVRSNCAAVLQAAAATFPSLSRRGRVDLTVDIYIDAETEAQSLWNTPQFRGRDHLVFADYGPNDCMLADLQARRVISRFSSATAEDPGYWKQVIFPVLLGIAGAVVGVTALHCACLQYKGEGLLITGESGAGKSTLSFELARRGLGFISDDWTYFYRTGTEIMAWGLPAKIKLLPDSIAHFPELRGYVPVPHLNGELALQIDPEAVGAKRDLWCRPARIILLNRQPGSCLELAPVAANEMAAYFQQSLERLPACLARYRDAQLAIIRALCRSECWYLRCGGSPQEIATHILRACEGMPSAPPITSPHLQVTRREWPDMLRRFVHLPLQQQFSAGGRSFQVETDSERIMGALRSIAEPGAFSPASDFCWSIQEEPEWDGNGNPATGLAGGALSFLSVGGHSFVAYDRYLGRAITFIGAANPGQELKSTLQTMLRHLVREAAPATLPSPSGFVSAAESRARQTSRHADA